MIFSREVHWLEIKVLFTVPVDRLNKAQSKEQVFLNIQAVKMSMMMDLKLLLSKLTKNHLDRFELLTECRRFKIDVEQAGSFSKEKHLLQRVVLLELIKNRELREEQLLCYQALLTETNNFLHLEDPAQKRPDVYLCMFPGCLFQCGGHRGYLSHLQHVHPHSEMYRCNYRKICQRNFLNLEDLRIHVDSFHRVPTNKLTRQPIKSGLIGVSCKCLKLSCGQKVFDSARELTLHLNTKHFNENRVCCFLDCKTTFNPGSASRHHFGRKHFTPGLCVLKSSHVIGGLPSQPPLESLSILPSDSTDSADLYCEGMDEEEESADETGDNVEDDKVGIQYEMAYADFLNRMVTVRFIPVTTANEIAAEYLSQARLASKNREEQMRRSLSNKIDKDLIEGVIRECQADPFLLAQEKLSSEVKRRNFVEENFKFVKPKEIVLNKTEMKSGASKECLHYTSILDGLKVLLEDSSFQKAAHLSRNKEYQEDIISDIKDGNIFKTSKYFLENPDSLVLMMYSDGIEVTNPLASGRGKHKLISVYWQLAEVPRYLRSKVDRLNLTMVFKEKLLKKYSHGEIFKCLLEDLKVLENHGVKIYKPFPRVVKAGLLLYSGDNLESHQIGGFSACFSSKDICRYCHCQYDDLKKNIHDHAPWTEKEYNDHEIEEEWEAQPKELLRSENLFDEHEEPYTMDGDDSELEDEDDDDEDDEEEDEDEDESEREEARDWGVKRKCVFNSLQSFHCVTSMPPDSLHDLLEGVIPQDLLGIIRILSSKGWFSIENYNKALKVFQYSPSETADKPQIVSNSSKSRKLTGKALSQLVHMRNFLLILHFNGWILDDNDPVLKLALLLNEVTERIMAEVFRVFELRILSDLVTEYLEFRQQVFEEHPELGKIKPKHHYLLHYAKAIFDFGPPSCFWTARYEAKHRTIKGIVDSAKNFINISKTVSVRHQLRMCSVYFNGLYDVEEFKLPVKVQTKEEVDQTSDSDRLLRDFMAEDDLVCSKIEYRSRKYCVGCIVIMKRSSRTSLEVGLIKAILVRRKKVFLLVRRYQMEETLHGIFRNSVSSINADLELTNIETLLDSPPIYKKGTEEMFIIVLHHHVSFNYM